MSRSLGIPLMLVSLVAGGYLLLQQSKTAGPAAPAVTQAETQANASVAATNFQGAGAALQAYFADSGTYAGATLPPGSGVVLVRADATSYCLQEGSGLAAEHEVGPGGQAQPGAC